MVHVGFHRWFKPAARRIPLCLAAFVAALGAEGGQTNAGVCFDFEALSAEYQVLDASLLTRTATGRAASGAAAAQPIRGDRSLLVHTLKSPHKWNKAFITRVGLFKPRTLYSVTLEYEGGAQAGAEPSQLYCYLRSEKAGNEKDLAWQRLNLYQGEQGKLHFKVNTGELDDYALHLGCYGKGSFVIDDIRIRPYAGRTVVAPTALKEAPTSKALARVTGADESLIRILEPAVGMAPRLSIRDFGGGAEKPDNFDAIQSALARCSNGPAYLSFPKGLYRVLLKPGGLKLHGASNFIIDGNGSELRFYSDTRTDGRAVRCYFDVMGCSRFELRNFAFDWDWDLDPIASRAEVVGIQKDGASLELRFLDHSQFPRREVLVEHLNPLDPAASTVGFEGSAERDIYQLDASGHTWLSGNTLRVAVKPAHRAKFVPGPELWVGLRYLVRHYKYRIHGMRMVDNTHFSVTDLDLYSTPGSGIILSGDTRHFKFENCRITRRDATRFISTASDHFNVQDSLGFFKVLGCEFAYGGDDGINIHDNNSQGFIAKEDRLIVLENVVSWRNKFHPGDLLEFRNADLSPTGFAAAIEELVGYSPEAEARATLRLARPLPPRVRPDSIVFNRRYESQQYVIRGCSFHENRARGILTHGPNVTIESNRFYRTQGPALRLLCGNERRWGEGYGATNVLIRDNVFSNCNVSGQNEERPDLAIDTYLGGGRSKYPVFQDLAIIGNTFIDPSGAPLFIASARRVLVARNELRGATPRRNPLPTRGQFVLSQASDCHFETNQWSRTPHITAPGFCFDEDEVSGLFWRGNRVTEGAAP